MTTRVESRELDDGIGGRTVLGFLGSKALPKLKLGPHYLPRADSEKRAASAREAPRSLSARTPASASSRRAGPPSFKTSCYLASSSLGKTDELSGLPGGLLLARLRDVGHFCGTGSSDALDSPAAAMTPTCDLLGKPSPIGLGSTRLWRMERMGRRRKACHQPKPVSSPEPPLSSRKPQEVPASEDEKTVTLKPSKPRGDAPVIAFSRLRMGELADVGSRRAKVTSARSARHDEAQPHQFSGGGIFSEEVLAHYDVDDNGRLGAGELGSMLRHNGMCLDYVGSNRVLEMIAGAGVQSISCKDFPSCVLRLVEKRRGTAGEAAEVLQCVFRSYVEQSTGTIVSHSRLLADLGRKPKTKEEWEDQSALVASCRAEAVSGPLSFQEFIVLMRKVNAGTF